MCGIAGLVAWDRPDAVRATHAVRAMVDQLTHRGPDGQGVVVNGEMRGASAPLAVLGHTRLAVIDLSDRAAQPMASADHAVVVSFNGEIYNFRELRDALEARGRRFRSASDTEVILHGYLEWGVEVVEKLRGMFAFGLWDRVRGELLLVRDRLGIKPLYFHRGAGWMAFASEIRALLATGLVPGTLDAVALEQYLTHQTVPTPRTLVRDVQMVEPATVLTIDAAGGVRTRRYWDLLPASNDVDAGADRTAVTRRVRERLLESAELHLVSDVPVGLFLSGGVDSTALVALVRELGVVPRTFAVAFPRTPFDESAYARAAAEALGSEHVEIPVDEDDLVAALPDVLDGVDHPSGDGINTAVVSRAVRKAGVSVAWSGLGGDEFFGGYPSFRRMRRLAAYSGMWRRTPESVRSIAAGLVRLGGAGITADKAAALIESDASLPRAFPLLRQLFVRSERRRLLGHRADVESRQGADPYEELLDAAVERSGHTGLMALVSYAEARTYMHDVLLRDTDQMSMRYGLEVRVPLLDHRLVELLMRVPDDVKMDGGRPKALLIDSLGVRLPDVCVRRPKGGFVLPFELWMRGALRPFCERHLGQIGERGVFEPAAVARLWRAFLSGSRRTSWARPWALVALDAWLERTGVRV
jgi:asparagine synthase (glutamine-hydrolysing)